ncbi:mRNA splicing protein SLU7 [Sporobolomyces koalae]|uniref:mRNA splicing protein SLU7 n=1 Tax=Sporobolomyces koalae TaxID=500713 RepID=UPI0031729D8B
MSGKLSREEYRKQKDLEAARKAGTAAPAYDEEGKPINPHIPEFMSNAPWYLRASANEGPSLKHHKAPGKYNADPNKLGERYQRGAKSGPAAKKYRPGACTNCGAMTHKTKDCLERPRKVGAKYSNKDIAPDEVLFDHNTGLNGQEGFGDYDAKRDRWDGYDPSSHKQVVEEHEALEAARRKLREEAIDKGTAEAGSKEVKSLAKQGKAAKGKGKKAQQDQDDHDDFGSSDESENDGGEDEDKYADSADVAGQKLDTKTRVTVRNLRIREDTAKYLMNLDTESAYYDPKTRSMREAPKQGDDATFVGDNFARHSGGATEVQKLQMFAWQSEQRGHNVHIQSNPTAAALMHKEFLEKKDVLKDKSAASILEKYGGEQYLQSVPKELRSGQTEHYVEYDRRGKVVKGMERAKAKSKYDEDVYPGNHKSIWGSWYSIDSGRWGFACCHSLIKGSYCAGQAGIEAAKAEQAGELLTLPSTSKSDPNAGKSLMQIKAEKDEEERRKRKVAGIDEGEDAERKRRKKEEDEKDAMGVSEKEMESYRKNREHRFDDPLLQMSKDELLPL